MSNTHISIQHFLTCQVIFGSYLQSPLTHNISRRFLVHSFTFCLRQSKAKRVIVKVFHENPTYISSIQSLASNHRESRICLRAFILLPYIIFGNHTVKSTKYAYCCMRIVYTIHFTQKEMFSSGMNCKIVYQRKFM